MNQAINRFRPSKIKGFLSFSSLGEWCIEHIEIVALVICLIGYQYFAYQRAQMAKTIILNPQMNDFFFVDYFALDKKSDPKYRFIPIKVLDVSQDNVTFKIGNIAHTTEVSPRDHMKFDQAMQNNFYRVGTLSLSKEKINELLKSGIIYNARRPKNIYIDGWIALTLSELSSN